MIEPDSLNPDKIDKEMAKEYVNEFIKIANLLPLLKLGIKEVPDYEMELQIRHIKKTGKLLDLNSSINRSANCLYFEDHKEGLETISETWSEIEKKYPRLVEYAMTGSETVVGENVFSYIPTQKEFEEAQKSKLRLKARSVEAFKLENFIRLTRIAHNIRLIAIDLDAMEKMPTKETIHHVRRPNPSHARIPNDKARLGWRDVFYSIPDSVIPQNLRQYDYEFKKVNNKRTGKIIFIPSFIEQVLTEIDILQIRLCGYCTKIFFAEPRNKRYCSQKCNNGIKNKQYYANKKRQSMSFKLPMSYHDWLLAKFKAEDETDPKQ